MSGYSGSWTHFPRHQWKADWTPLATTYDRVAVGSINGSAKKPHDKALKRAESAKYRPNAKVVGDPDRTLFVGRLNSETTEETIRTAFSAYGSLENCRLVRNVVTGHSRRYAFVEFRHRSDMLRAREKAHKTVIDDYQILVEEELERKLPGWKPRRLGGGFGGKKQSGQLRFGCRDRPWKRPFPSAR